MNQGEPAASDKLKAVEAWLERWEEIAEEIGHGVIGQKELAGLRAIVSPKNADSSTSRPQ